MPSRRAPRRRRSPPAAARRRRPQRSSCTVIRPPRPGRLASRASPKRTRARRRPAPGRARDEHLARRASVASRVASTTGRAGRSSSREARPRGARPPGAVRRPPPGARWAQAQPRRLRCGTPARGACRAYSPTTSRAPGGARGRARATRNGVDPSCSVRRRRARLRGSAGTAAPTVTRPRRPLRDDRRRRPEHLVRCVADDRRAGPRHRLGGVEAAAPALIWPPISALPVTSESVSDSSTGGPLRNTPFQTPPPCAVAVGPARLARCCGSPACGSCSSRLLLNTAAPLTTANPSRLAATAVLPLIVLVANPCEVGAARGSRRPRGRRYTRRARVRREPHGVADDVHVGERAAALEVATALPAGPVSSVLQRVGLDAIAGDLACRASWSGLVEHVERRVVDDRLRHSARARSRRCPRTPSARSSSARGWRSARRPRAICDVQQLVPRRTRGGRWSGSARLALIELSRIVASGGVVLDE